MKRFIRLLREFISRLSGFLIPSLVVIPLVICSIYLPKQPADSEEKSIASLFDFSSTDLVLVFLAIYAILKKPWRENLSEHFKKAYRTQLKSIQKIVKERDTLREECNTFSVHQMSFDSLLT